MSRARQQDTILLVGILALFAFLFFPSYNGISHRSPTVKVVNEVKNLLIGCRAYARDHEGRFPDEISALYPDYVDLREVLTLRDDKGREIPYRYGKGLTTSCDPLEELIIAPFPVDGKLVIGLAGGTVKQLE